MKLYTFSLIFLLISCTNKKNSEYKLQDWPQSSNEMSMGQVTGVDITSENQVVVFHRANRIWTDPMPAQNILLATIFVYDALSGDLIKYWGENEFIMPHGLSVDKEDNIWVTDVGAHQIKKFSGNGELLLSIGKRGVSGNDEITFDRPTDIGFDKSGNFYVSDGYINSRIVKYSKDGVYLKEWGTKGEKPGEFDLPHGITIDNNDNIFVADRSNSRIQVFDINGIFLYEISGKEFGRPYGSFAIGSKLFIIDGGDQPSNTCSRVVIFDLLNQNYIGEFDASISLDNKNLGHDIVASNDNMIFVADAWSNTIRKFKL
jgi:peptidylamidoglycolate lyase|tara:strand:+ start:59 stop:1006 length:948 start_codon:yes stop_codon:yes gene_type:complete